MCVMSFMNCVARLKFLVNWKMQLSLYVTRYSDVYVDGYMQIVGDMQIANCNMEHNPQKNGSQ